MKQTLISKDCVTPLIHDFDVYNKKKNTQCIEDHIIGLGFSPNQPNYCIERPISQLKQ